MTSAGKPKTERRMLYEECDICGGTGRSTVISSTPGLVIPMDCACKPMRVLITGITIPQVETLVELDAIRREAGISAAMLRDGRAAAFRDLLAACRETEEDQLALETIALVLCSKGNDSLTFVERVTMEWAQKRLIEIFAIAKATKGEP